MIYKEYGKTKKLVSAIGFGGMRFEKENEQYNIEKCAELLIEANQLGINYFDTAPGYNNDQGEIIFGEAFKNMPNEFFVSTKSLAKSELEFRKDLEKSLRRMNINKINFFHIWCVLNLDDYKRRLVKNGPYEAALRAKNEGLIEHIVISTHCNGDEIIKIIEDDLFEGITIGYNVLNYPYRQKGLKAAYEKGLGIATMNPLDGGIIPLNAEYFDFIKSEDDRSVVEAALRFNISHKEISTVLVGFSNLGQLHENIEYCNEIRPIDESKLKVIESKLSSSLNELCTGCRYCDKCPRGVEIPKMMIAYNQKMLKGLEQGLVCLRMDWGLEPEHSGLCNECRLCESKCTQHLSITDRLKEIRNWV